MPSQTDTLDLVANSGAVMTATQWLETISVRESWPLALTFALTISLDEALTNIVSYAFRIDHSVERDHRTDVDSAPCSIRLSCTSFNNQVRIDITDNGFPYDPTKANTPPLPESVEHARFGGHGLRLMRHYLSDISYFRRDQENHLTLIATVKGDDIV